jgi:hypothetical protein
MTAPLLAFLDTLLPAHPRALGPWTLVPLCGPGEGPAMQVLGPETARVEELPSPDVNRVLVHNLSPLPLLVLGGELLVGARQNRIANASALVAAGSTHTLAVSCVQQGRWAEGAMGRRFSTAPVVAPHTLRSRTLARSSRARRARGHHDGGQGEVWAEVAQTLSECGADSPTSDLHAALDTERAAAAAAKWRPMPGELGVLVLRGDEVVGLEVVGRPDVWAALAPRVLGGLALDASEATPASLLPTHVLAQLREELAAVQLVSLPGAATGVEVHGDTESLQASALLQEDRPAHVRLTRVVDEGGPGRGRDRPLRRLCRAAIETAPKRVHVTGPFLVSPARDLVTALPIAASHRALPIPHRSGAGLVLWEASEPDGLRDLVEALRALQMRAWLGTPAQARAGEGPAWLFSRKSQSRRGGVVVRLREEGA